MPIKEFPPIEQADESGLLAVGGDLSVQSLLLAYKSGIFIWPLDKKHLTWFAPPKRAILEFDNFHTSKSFLKTLKKDIFEIRINFDFRSVISQCAKVPRKENRGTWITNDIIDSFTNLHKSGYAHSYETWLNGELVGGIYGVQINNFFGAESMFHTHSEASKVALFYCIQDLANQGITWLDCQIQNEFLEKLGVIEISREKFMEKLAISLM